MKVDWKIVLSVAIALIGVLVGLKVLFTKVLPADVRQKAAPYVPSSLIS